MKTEWWAIMKRLGLKKPPGKHSKVCAGNRERKRKRPETVGTV